MLFYLTTLDLVRFLTEKGLNMKEHDFDVLTVSALEAWKLSNFIYQNNVSKGLHESLCNVYYKIKTTIEMWKSLDRKYKIQDVGGKKFHRLIIFIDYKMIDSKTVHN